MFCSEEDISNLIDVLLSELIERARKMTRARSNNHPWLSMDDEEMDNVFVRTDPAGNIKMDKEKSTEKIDAAVATVMALDRAIRNGCSEGSVYDDRGILVF